MGPSRTLGGPVSHYRPTATELVAAVAEFLETEVRAATDGAVNFHARVAANALRIVERELSQHGAEPGLPGFDDEQALARAIRDGDFDDRGPELEPVLRALVRHRLDAAHPGYADE
ncbi:DUF6285 domain-containing protein [Mycolicibacterium mucogenicum]|uniref:DUF6285 domain-containing protein n=1 Tax=Mycolicibacterium mucogenicum TaxID=56689 RepID=UPI0006B300CF|nr:DUF6285 domain-containing protein [Mycolicibacterium mucogenicum]